MVALVISLSSLLNLLSRSLFLGSQRVSKNHLLIVAHSTILCSYGIYLVRLVVFTLDIPVWEGRRAEAGRAGGRGIELTIVRK